MQHYIYIYIGITGKDGVLWLKAAKDTGKGTPSNTTSPQDSPIMLSSKRFRYWQLRAMSRGNVTGSICGDTHMRLMTNSENVFVQGGDAVLLSNRWVT